MRTYELERAPRALAIDQQGDYVAVVDDGDRFSVYETSEWKCLWSDGTNKLPSNVWLDYKTGRLVHTAWEYVGIYDPRRKLRLARYSHELPVTSLDVDLDRGVLVTGGQDGVARLNRLEDGEPLGTIEQGPGISAVRLPSGGGVLTGDVQGTIRYWAGFDQSTDVRRRSLAGELRAACHVSFRSDGKLLAVHGWPKEYLILWDTQTWAMKKHEIPEMNEWLCRFRPGTNELAVGVDETIRFYETTGLEIEEVRVIETQGEAKFGCFSDDGRLFGAYFVDSGIGLFDLETGRERLLEPNVQGNCGVAITRDGNRFAVQEHQSGNTYVWDTKTGRKVQTIQTPVLIHWDAGIAIHADGNVLATSADDGTISLWSVESGELIRELKGHSEPMGRLEFSPDGNRLLSGGSDQTIRVWDWRLGQELLKLSNGNYCALSSTFSPDGRWIANTDANPDARVSFALPWDTDNHIRTFPGLTEAKDKLETLSLETVTDSLGIDLALIPPGEFEMGSTQETVDQLKAIVEGTEWGTWFVRYLVGEAPRHHVRITRPFYLATREVTVGQFRTFVDATGYTTEAERRNASLVSQATEPDAKGQADEEPTWRRPGFLQADDHPVVLVTWNDATAFCEWLSQHEGQKYRLPTEAEWEYACRASELAWDHILPHNRETLGLLEWFGHNSGGMTHPVGQKKFNRWRLFDMRGNASEWCQDWHEIDYYESSPTDDPAGPENGTRRVVRGGHYFATHQCRAAYRFGIEPDLVFPWLGFRVARQADPAPQPVSAPSDN